MARPKGITKGDIDFSLRGETSFENDQELHVQSVLSDAVQNRPQKANVIFKLVKTKRNGGTHISGIADIRRKKEDGSTTVERARLLAGVDTIWMSEQLKLGITKEYAEQNVRSLVFPRGAKFLAIPVDDVTALEFLRNHPYNVGSPDKKTGGIFDFFEYDPEKQQKEALEREMFEIEMTMAASQQDEAYMRRHAAYLGIPLVDEFGIPKNEQGIRREYMVAAKRNPQLFKRTLKSREVELNYLIRTAMSQGKIDLGAVNGAATWAATGAVICRIPSGANPPEYLLELAMTNSPEGKEFVNSLQAVMSV